jgi:endonuclease YncB( thermonuclease family)
MLKSTSVLAALALAAAAISPAPAQAAASTDDLGAIVAMVTYAADNCPDYKVNGPMVATIMAANGITAPVPEPVLISAAVMRQKFANLDHEVVCALMWSKFGSGGTVVSGVFTR